MCGHRGRENQNKNADGQQRSGLEGIFRGEADESREGRGAPAVGAGRQGPGHPRSDREVQRTRETDGGAVGLAGETARLGGEGEEPRLGQQPRQEHGRAVQQTPAKGMKMRIKSFQC